MTTDPFGTHAHCSRGDPERELLTIPLDRDEITEDRFDRIIRGAPVLDFDRTIIRAELFHRLAAVFADRRELEAADIEATLEAGETASSGPKVRPYSIWLR